MKQQLYFHHIPKTGGTTLISLVEMHVPRELVCPADSIDELRCYTRSDLRRFVFFRGTFANELVPMLSEPPVRVTLLRDPVERAISQYLMNERLSGNNAVTPLPEVMRDPRWRTIFRNYIARYLVFEFTDAVRRWTPPFPVPADHIEQARADHFPLDETDFRSRALAALLSFDIVGTTAYVYECYERICEVMGWSGRVTERFRNTGNGREALRQLEELSEADFDLLLAENSVDVFLYQVASQLVRLRTVPATVP